MLLLSAVAIADVEMQRCSAAEAVDDAGMQYSDVVQITSWCIKPNQPQQLRACNALPCTCILVVYSVFLLVFSLRTRSDF